MRLLLRAATTLFLLSAAPAQAAEGAGRCEGALTVPQSAQDLKVAAKATACLVNAERKSRGLPKLDRDSRLARAARRHSKDMVRRDYFAHTSPGGGTLKDRVRKARYADPDKGWRAGEALGWGTGQRATPNSLVDAWLASTKHREIVLARDYRELGIGVVTGAPKQGGSGLPGATYTLNTGVIR
jgi:uncharacterized protein YkwD